MSSVSLPALTQSQSLTNMNDSIYFSRMQKKQSEEEAKRIEARINMLKQEQNKLLKKIEQTDTKAYEIYLQKKALLEKKLEQQRQKTQLAKPTFYQESLVKRDQVRQIVRNDHDRKYTEALSLKKDIKCELDAIQLEKKVRQESLKARARQLKQEEDFATHSAVQKLRERRAKVRMDLLQEREQLLKDKLHYDNLIIELERKELDQLNQLQSTQLRSSQVQQKLEEAQKLKPNQFEQSYGSLPPIK